MMRLVILVIFIFVGYVIVHYLKEMFKAEVRQRSERDYRRRDRENPATEQDYRRILGVTDKDGPAAVRKKYKELLAKYHPDKVQHLGVEFQELAERKTREIIRAYEFFRKK